MNWERIEGIANAVLYEGYMLYPYRLSAVKNRQRWNLGVVYPRSYCEIQKGNDVWRMQTQCLIRGDASASVDIKVRFLQAVSRQMGRLTAPGVPDEAEPEFEIVESIEIGNRTFRPWQEAIEREVTLQSVRLETLLGAPVSEVFAFPGAHELEAVKDDSGSIAALVVQTRERISGSVDVSAEKCSAGLFKLAVVISNLTPLDAPQFVPRDDVLLKSLLSTHTILGVEAGEFVSLIDPPPDVQQIASDCRNVGAWPVLAGDDRCKDAMLSSPIILYDYPQIAPESPGDLFDGTEIDEILALRILTLSDDEKREILQGDERTREVLQRTEAMPVEHFVKLHGVLRGMKSAGDPGDEIAREGSKPATTRDPGTTRAQVSQGKAVRAHGA